MISSFRALLENRELGFFNYFSDIRWSRERTSVGIKASPCDPVANSVRKKKTREERWMKVEGFWDKEERKNRVVCRRSCIPARLADAARCGGTLLYCYMYYKIYYGFTAALLRREHRRPPVLLSATTGHVHETIDDPPPPPKVYVIFICFSFSLRFPVSG